MKRYVGGVIDGQRLDFPEYGRDYTMRLTAAGGRAVKLERQQHFIEPENPSWCALFEDGNWARSLELFAAMVADMRAEQDRRSCRGDQFRRVRVVELPPTPYLHWELRGLLTRTECGERIVVVTPEQVAQYEQRAVLPEIVVIGTAVYQVLYGDNGAVMGAVVSTDPAEVRHWTTVLETLFAAGEPLASFFAREVSELPPPSVSFDADGRPQITPAARSRP